MTTYRVGTSKGNLQQTCDADATAGSNAVAAHLIEYLHATRSVAWRNGQVRATWPDFWTQPCRRSGAVANVGVTCDGYELGMTPSCCMKLSWSIASQCSTICPFWIRMMSTYCSLTRFPVGGMPFNSAVWVPSNVFFVTT
jgi:hypothetical protein